MHKLIAGVCTTLSLLAVTLPSGCVAGPTALRASRLNYNRAIQETTNEQLLLNLVRLKYRDVPFFLEVSSVSAQFIYQGSLDGAITFNENIGPNPRNPDVYGIGAGLGYSEKPTISYAPLQGEDFVERLLSPLSIDTILLLARSGWSLDRVLRMTVQRINHLDNASNASSPTPLLAPTFEDFRQMAHLLRQLQMNRAIEIGYRTTQRRMSDTVGVNGITLQDTLSALQSGYHIERTDDDTGYVLAKSITTPVLTIAPEWMDSTEVGELIDMLGLKPGRSQYDLTAAAGDLQRSAPFDSVILETRSLMGVLFYLSHGIEVPPSHAKRGLVTRTIDEHSEPFDWAGVTGDLLRIRSQATKPAHAAVATYYRGTWFYIDDAELNSKSTFALLSQLFALKAGVEQHEGPVLTLPVGG